ncbi:MAG: hypothetical protein JKX83_07260 [Pseudomonadales bacterium]|nr:hypothetical protein [Pseudomonadales bacterium]
MTCVSPTVFGSSFWIDIISDSATRTFSAINEVDASADATGIRLRFTLDTGDNRAIERYFSSYDIDSATDIDTIEDNEIELGANLLILGAPSTFTPFAEFGAGYGIVPIDPTVFSDDSILNVHLNVGAGLKLMVSENFHLVGNIEVIY